MQSLKGLGSHAQLQNPLQWYSYQTLHFVL
jgi:hypothetical protein